MSRIAATATLLLSATAVAGPSNRGLIPFGERAAMLGNAGITSPAGEAVYYNPANLARIGHPNLSVSGSTYMLYQLSVDPIVVLQGEDQKFEASGFVAIPSTVISTYQIGRLSLASAVLVPEALTFKNRLTFETSMARVTIIQNRQESQLWLGGGAALELADGVYAGVSVFAANTTESSYSYTRAQTGIDPVTQVTERTSSTDISVIGLTAIAGLQIQRGPLGIGARLHSPSIRLSGSGDNYSAASVVSQAMPAAQDTELEDVSVDRPLPIDAGVGVSYPATPALRLLADVNLQLGARLTTVDDPRLPTAESELNAAPRGALGMELEVATKKWLRAGFVVNRSALAEPDNADDAVREDYVGGTLGFAWQSGRTHTALGVFYLHGSIQTFVEGATPPREADATGRLFGGLFTVSYRL
ncbi:MAG: hypothetical protein WKG01_22170 [Kofleriaceae bacterium]